MRRINIEEEGGEEEQLMGGQETEQLIGGREGGSESNGAEVATTTGAEAKPAAPGPVSGPSPRLTDTIPSSTSLRAPTTGYEFQKAWKNLRSSPRARWEYLKVCSNVVVPLVHILPSRCR